MTLACLVASLATFYLLVATTKAEFHEAIRLLGWWPIGTTDLFRCCSLTLLLYIGPLFEKIFIERDLDDFRRGQSVVESLSSWIGYRNYIAGPVTEEIIFRGVIVPLHLIAKMPASKIVFVAPLYFGIAHIHHFYEFRLTHPHTALLSATLRSVLQFAYTSLFGWFATFIYLRTGSLYACIVIHMFCNWVGLPRFWGRVRRREVYGAAPVLLRAKEDFTAQNVIFHGTGEKLTIGWSVAYYFLLFAGAFAFRVAFWPLSESPRALAILRQRPLSS